MALFVNAQVAALPLLRRQQIGRGCVKGGGAGGDFVVGLTGFLQLLRNIGGFRQFLQIT